MADWKVNQDDEKVVVITGIARPSNSMDGKDFQKLICGKVQAMVNSLFQPSSGPPVRFVRNVSGGNTNRPMVIEANFDDGKAGRAIRDKFAVYFRPSPPPRPDVLKDINMKNKTTHGTRVRVTILRAIGENYKAKNTGAHFSVASFESRPKLTINPPPTAANRRPMKFLFTEALQKLPTLFSDSDKTSMFRAVSQGFRGSGELKKTFMVLDDDERDKFLPIKPSGSSGKAGTKRPLEEESGSSSSSTPSKRFLKK